MNKSALWVTGLLAMGPAVPAAEPQKDLSGVYRCEGKNYSGTTIIRKSGEAYELLWSIGGDTHQGVGLHHGPWLSASWLPAHADAVPGIVVYRIEPGGKLRGSYTSYPGGRRETETLTYQSAHVEAAKPPPQPSTAAPASPAAPSTGVPWRTDGTLQPDEIKHIRKLVDLLKGRSLEKGQAAVKEISAYKEDPAAAQKVIDLVSADLRAGEFRTTPSKMFALAALTYLSVGPKSYIEKTGDLRGLHNDSVDRPVLELLGDPDKNIRLLAYTDTLLFSIMTGEDLETWIRRRVQETRAASRLPEAFAADIHFPYLYSADTLADILDQASSAKPLAVLLVAKQSLDNPERLEGSIAFFGLGALVQDIQKEGYRVIVRELDSACELPTALEQAAGYGQIQLLTIAVHGTSDSFEFGSARDGRCTEEGVAKMRRAESWKHFAPESQVILLSCLTGLGRDRVDNVANMLRSVLPRALVTSILAPSNVTVLPDRLHFDSKHHVDRFIGDKMPALYKN